MNFKILVSLIAVGASFNAQAQKAGDWLIQGNITRIAPDVSSGTLSAPFPGDTQTDVGSDTRVTGQIAYMLTDRWSLALPLGTGFKHKLYGAGTGGAGVGQIGTVSAMPITVFGRYHFVSGSGAWRPYAMLGLTYARFHDAQGSAALDALNPANPSGGHTGLSVDSRWALSPGLGVSWVLSDRWFVDAAYSKSLLKTTTTLSTGQKIDTKLDPDVWQFGLGYRF